MTTQLRRRLRAFGAELRWAWGATWGTFREIVRTPRDVLLFFVVLPGTLTVVILTISTAIQEGTHP